jgi:hypothetical protein
VVAGVVVAVFVAALLAAALLAVARFAGAFVVFAVFAGDFAAVDLLAVFRAAADVGVFFATAFLPTAFVDAAFFTGATDFAGALRALLAAEVAEADALVAADFVARFAAAVFFAAGCAFFALPLDGSATTLALPYRRCLCPVA